MRRLLLIAVLAVVITTAVLIMSSRWTPSGQTQTASISNIKAAREPQADTRILTSSNRATSKSSFHIYSPLHDPPPQPTADELKKWREELNNQLLQGVMPNLEGAPFASIYSAEASKANKGNTQAAAILFKGLYFCGKKTLANLQNKDQLSNAVARMHVTLDDRWGVATNNVQKAITHVRQQYRYCSGINMEERSAIGHWASLAVKQNDPYISAHAWPYLSKKDLGVNTTNSLLVKRQQIIDEAAHSGVPVAWQYKWERYSTDGKPIRAYASLYTEYLLTHSPYLSYQIWEMSQQLTPFQIQEAENSAEQEYQNIKKY